MSRYRALKAAGSLTGAALTLYAYALWLGDWRYAAVGALPSLMAARLLIPRKRRSL